MGDRGSHANQSRHRPLAATERTRDRLAGAVLHTDHGAQHTSRALADAYRQAGVRQSMSAIGSSADNALAESFNATFKRETLQGRKTWSSECRGPPRRVPLAGTATTPDAATPASDTAARSPTKPHPEHHQLR
ncbi:transposase [Streptomyces sp. T1317-0309]|nr:transposase [Streptomyces sp. T1317-0309]